MLSKLDLSKQIPMAPEHIEKTSFICQQGKYEVIRIPFGVKNAPAVFQALMTDLLSWCRDFCSPYMDDILIFSKDWDDHKLHVYQVLQKLKEAGLTANPAKCHWGGTKMEFLVTWLGRVACQFLTTGSKH